MKIAGWISSPFSERIALAVIRVEPDEIADIEKMARLLDGDSGHFGIKAELVSTDERVLISDYIAKRKNNKFPPYQVGFEPQIIKRTRYYEVMVSRD